ncbi:L-aspartate oxidase [Amaricoccus solimangrovi]|uniref:L-aspartate oxidase n=1 Tax=Amaricoccus solimangrovi TaxID=2589815 RepID=A0A501WM63_9RHOB|nr:L-aspartate oxidase [Amaricoccus solimangrovi]TPE49264.1 L-aspartate oxidase [Amaricoccus solimangrovi]
MTATPVTETQRVVIVGAGLAALYAALSLAPRPVLVISPGALGEGASSAFAQGGVAAAVGPGDSPAEHAADTARAGAGTVDPLVAGQVTAEALEHVLALAERGAPFDRTAEGGFVLSREAAHGRARVVRVKGDGAGRAIMTALIAVTRSTPSVQVLEGLIATGLETEGGRVTGLRLAAADGHSGEGVLRAPAVLLATGGVGGLYARTTNPGTIRGQGLGIAARAGAAVADAEFVQFHPTAIDCDADPLPLATEALRGEGAVLVDAEGRRFMPDIHPDAELAPRDVVARAVFAEWRAGRRPMLDTRAAIGEAIDTRFPTVTASCRALGIDPARAPIPVAAAAHYHMGGIAVGATGRSSLPGLWAIGEVSSTGLHGANRLASNGLLEALVYGRAAAHDIAGALGAPGAAPEAGFAPPPGEVAAPAEAVADLRRIMTEEVGVTRSGEGLRAALRGIAELEARTDSPVLRAMTAAATLIAAAALAREESRGGHYRTDFPAPDPARALRSRMTLAAAERIRAAALGEVAA